MKEVEVIPYQPEFYWKNDKIYDGIYSSCRFSHKEEFITKFPIVMKVKVDVPLLTEIGEKQYVERVIQKLNEPPPPPKYSGKGRRPKQTGPKYGKLDVISYRFLKRESLNFVELKLYTSDSNNKLFFDFNAGKQVAVKPDGRKNRKQKEEQEYEV